MKYQKLNQEMIRYYDNVKARPFNPTFDSYNVAPSLGFTIGRSQSMKSIGVKSVMNDSQRPIQNKYRQSDEQSPNKASFGNSQRRSQSNLLNYGMSSLSPISPRKRQINDKDIYEKQAKKYNIVTIQPKQYLDSINIFPKYRLQNSDESFHKKNIASSQLLATRNNSIKIRPMQSILDQKLNINPEYFSETPSRNKQSR